MAKNKAYWEERANKGLVKQEQTAVQVMEDLKPAYKNAINEIKKEIEVFYGKYAENNQITLQEAKKILNSDELLSFRETLKRYMDELGGYSPNPSYKRNLERLSTRSCITRLEELYVNLNNVLERLTSGVQSAREDYAGNVYQDSFYRTMFDFQIGIGFAVSFTQPPQRIIKAASQMNWQGSMFSSQVWENKDRLIKQLQLTIPQSLARGQSIQQMTSAISNNLGANYKNVKRVVRTEVNAIYNEARGSCYDDLNVEEYVYVATLDNKTSRICASLDGEKFKSKDREVGVNYPPMHGHCRSTSAPVIAGSEPFERIAKNKHGKNIMVPGDTTYMDWAKEYAPKKYNEYLKKKK